VVGEQAPAERADSRGAERAAGKPSGLAEERAAVLPRESDESLARALEPVAVRAP